MQFPEMDRAKACELLTIMAQSVPPDITMEQGFSVMVDTIIEVWPDLEATKQAKLLSSLSIILVRYADGRALETLLNPKGNA